MTLARAFLPSVTVHGMMAHAAFDDLTPEQWATRAHPDVNHPVWILAHLNGVRHALARCLGAALPDLPEPAPDFGDSCLEAAAYPGPEELVWDFDSLGTVLLERLAAVDEEQLARPYEPPFPDGAARTVAQALPFLISHEALHIGQLGLIRRLHGHPGLADVLLARLRAAAGG